METSVAESIFLPWWKILVYVTAVVIATVAIRITVKFDLNAFLKDRREDKKLSERKRDIEKCAHIWTLYTNSPYSRCDRCLCLISTSILLSLRQSSAPPVISATSNIFMTPGKDEFYIQSMVAGDKPPT